MGEISIREAQASDIPILAEIAYAALGGADVYKHFSPFNAFYPDDFRAALLSELQLRFVSPGQVIMVAEKDSPDPHKKGASVDPSALANRIAGFACWIRMNNAEGIAQWNSDSLPKSSLLVENAVCRVISLKPC
jgi:hypothetical protein